MAAAVLGRMRVVAAAAFQTLEATEAGVEGAAVVVAAGGGGGFIFLGVAGALLLLVGADPEAAAAEGAAVGRTRCCSVSCEREKKVSRKG